MNVICPHLVGSPFMTSWTGAGSSHTPVPSQVNPRGAELSDEGGGADWLNPHDYNYNSIVYNAPTGCCHCALNNGYVWHYMEYMPQGPWRFSCRINACKMMCIMHTVLNLVSLVFRY